LEGARIKAALWWIVYIPAATTAFYCDGGICQGAEAEHAADKSAAARPKAQVEELRPKAERQGSG